MSENKFRMVMETIIIVAIFGMASGMAIFFESAVFLWLLALLILVVKVERE